MKAKTNFHTFNIPTTSLTLMILSLGPQAKTAINIKDASFQKQFIDVRIPQTEIEIRRTYNSRSLYDGLFGFGWCSNLELQVQKTEPGVIELNHCNQKVRFEKDGNLYRYNQQRIAATAKGFMLIQNSLKYIFDRSGRLVTLQDRTGSRMDIKTDPQKRIRGMQSTKHSLVFLYSPRGKVTHISTTSFAPPYYRYKDDNLITARTAWGNTYHYTYDDMHNLTRIEYPDGTSEQMAFHAERDQLQRYVSRRNCQTQLIYKFHKERDYMAHLQKYCDNRKINDILMDFWHSTDFKQKSYLDRVRKTSDDQSLEVLYHPKTGNTVKIFNRNTSTNYHFDSQGRLSMIDSPKHRMKFTYSNRSRISSFQKLTKTTGRLSVYDYFYNKKGLLSRIQSNHNDAITLDYDEQDRIQQLAEGKTQIQFMYQSQMRQPSAILSDSNIVAINYETSKLTLERSLNQLTQETMNRFWTYLKPLEQLEKLRKCTTQPLWLYSSAVPQCDL